MMEDISIDGEFFDADFFAYREDADLAWRAQLYGWKCFIPRGRRLSCTPRSPGTALFALGLINMHSVKNRWLMRIKNITADLYARHCSPSPSATSW